MKHSARAVSTNRVYTTHHIMVVLRGVRVGAGTIAAKENLASVMGLDIYAKRRLNKAPPPDQGDACH